MQPSKIILKRGTVSSIPLLDFGELGFSTDTHELFVGTEVENIPVAGPSQTIGFVVDDVTDQVYAGATQFSLSVVAGSVLVFLNGLLQNPANVSLVGDGLSVSLSIGVAATDKVIILSAADPFI